MTQPFTVVFAGDSITDAERLSTSDGLGEGYVRLLAQSPEFAGVQVRNRGISGNSSRDLRQRWQSDVLDEQPDLVSIMVGINDTWRRYDSAVVTEVESFRENLAAMLSSLGDTPVVLIEPFLLPNSDEQLTWRADLDPKIAVVRELAAAAGAVLIPAGAALAAAGEAAEIAPDGVHPSADGHRILAQLWLDVAGHTLPAAR